MDEVAAAAGLTRATVYRHFRDHDELRRAAHLRVIDEAEEFVREAMTQPVERALVTIVRGAFGKAGLLRMLTGPRDYFDHRLTRRWTALSRPLVELFRDSQERGELRSDLPAAWLVEVLLYSAMTAHVSAALPACHDPAELVVSTFLDGARPR